MTFRVKRMIVMNRISALHLWVVQPGRCAWPAGGAVTAPGPLWLDCRPTAASHLRCAPLWLVERQAKSGPA